MVSFGVDVFVDLLGDVTADHTGARQREEAATGLSETVLRSPEPHQTVILNR